MTQVTFLQNWSGTISNNQVPGVPDNFGINILVELDCYLTGVRYYRHSSASSDRISQMQVYKWSAGGLLSAVLTPTDTGAAGWETAMLANPIRIPGGTEIQITGFVGSTLHMDYNSAAVPTPPPGFSWVSGHHRMFNPTSQLAFCPNGDNSWFYLLDAIFDDSASLPAPPTTGDVTSVVDNGLADWLSEGDAIHRVGDGIPWDTWQTVLTILSRGGSITSGDVTTYGLSDATWAAALVKLLGYAVSHADQIGQVLSWLGVGAKPSGTSTVPDQLTAILNASLGAQGESYWSAGQVLAPSSHTLVDSLPFAGRVGWGSGYALHRIHVDTVDDHHPFEDLGAAGYFARALGWWAPVMPGGIVGERRWLEWSDQWLWPAPIAATGVVIYVHPAVTGTLYAYSVE